MIKETKDLHSQDGADVDICLHKKKLTMHLDGSNIYTQGILSYTRGDQMKKSSSNDRKRTYTISSDTNAIAIDGFLQDLAIDQNSTPSRIIEQLVIERLTPSKSILPVEDILLLYAAEEKKLDPYEILIRFFQAIIAKSNTTTCSSIAGYKVLDYILARSNNELNENYDCDALRRFWKEVVDYIEFFESNDVGHKYLPERQYAHISLHQRMDELQNNKRIYPFEFYQIIRDYWDILCDYPITYAFLHEWLKAIKKHPNTAPRDRLELLDALNESALISSKPYYYPWRDSSSSLLSFTYKADDRDNGGGYSVYADEILVANLTTTTDLACWNLGKMPRELRYGLKDNNVWNQVLIAIKKVASETLKVKYLVAGAELQKIMPESEWGSYGFRFTYGNLNNVCFLEK